MPNTNPAKMQNPPAIPSFVGFSTPKFTHSILRRPDIVSGAEWRNPEEVKASYPKASILKASRVVFNIKGNDYRLVVRMQYQAGVLAIRFFGTHAEYDKIDAEEV
jgi:mRNA interferase HigB